MTRSDGVDNLPLDTDNEDQLILSWDIEGTILLGQTVEADLLTLRITVFLHILLGALEDNTTLLLLGLLLTTVSHMLRRQWKHKRHRRSHSDPKDG